jgi:adenosylhomocysteine nucleosidase
MREYHEGTLWGTPVALVFSRWGKVAAAATATHLISNYGVDAIVFTGVAGGVAHGVRAGDVVVGEALCQHDLDARPIFERHEVPLLGLTCFRADDRFKERLERAAKRFLESGLSADVRQSLRQDFGNPAPHLRTGWVVSGDQVFASREKVEELRARLPDTQCVEMEGAAVAQVCHEYGVPFGIVRTISDSADEDVHVDFMRFIERIAQVYARGILKEFLNPSAV